MAKMYDVIIRNGKVFDGSGNPWTKLDIGIKNGRIVKLGKMDNEAGKNEIDAQG